MTFYCFCFLVSVSVVHTGQYCPAAPCVSVLLISFMSDSPPPPVSPHTLAASGHWEGGDDVMAET